MAYANTFERKEIKFLLTREQYLSVRQALAPFMTEDSYGQHTIGNVYCDTENDDLVRASLEKPIYKEKLRLRCYGTPKSDSKAFLEIKKKFRGTVYKRRAELTYSEAWNYLAYGKPLSKRSQVLDEIDYMVKRLSLKPRIAIFYDRTALYGNEDRELRVTFDRNIRSRTSLLDLRNPCCGTRLADAPDYVMEIKVTGAMPLWLARKLSELEIHQGSFSKYGSIYLSSINRLDGGKRECLIV